MRTPENKTYSQEEYLVMDFHLENKYEFHQGKVTNLRGESINHNRITTNVITDLGNKLKGTNCEIFISDLRVHITINTLFTFPDISIYCDEIKKADVPFDTVTNPTVIIEVLSDSTRDYDKGSKFTLYRDIPTLQEYLLIDSEAVAVEIFRRNEDDTWTLYEYNALEDNLNLKSVGEVIELSETYEGVF